MWKWLRVLRGDKAAESSDGEELLALRREVQNLRMKLDEHERARSHLQAEVERQRSGESGRVAVAVQARLERLLSAAAGPVAQLLTQAHLLESDGKPVQARDVLAVARQLVRVLQDEGLELDGHVGQATAFDPSRHDPLGSEATLAPGQPVVIRFLGLSAGGKVLRKAGVERVQG
jgi:molecular chaperone GrpE (heat shock protein)